MAFIASAHCTALVVPPWELVEPLIDVFDPYDHWLWNGDFNERGEAVIEWKPPGTPAKVQKTWLFVVARLAYEHSGRKIPRGHCFMPKKECLAKPMCVNPVHWMTMSPEENRLRKRPMAITGGFENELVKFRR